MQDSMLQIPNISFTIKDERFSFTYLPLPLLSLCVSLLQDTKWDLEITIDDTKPKLFRHLLLV